MVQKSDRLETEVIGRKPIVVTLGLVVNVVGTLFSLFVVALIAYWAIKIPEKNINNLPIINALKGEIKSVPITSGGKKFFNENLSMYGNFVGNTKVEDKNKIVVKNQLSVNHKELKQEIRSDFKDESDQENLNNMIENVINQFKKEESKIKRVNLYLGSFDSLNQAKSFWQVVEKKNSDILTDVTFKIYENNDAVTVAYRLQLENLKSKASGKNLCSILNSRQFGCLVINE